MMVMMRGSVMVVVVVVLMGMVCLGSMVESARPMIEQRAGALETTTLEGDDGWRSETTMSAAGSRGGVDAVWDAESPPAQRQRDRSLWGMSKRLVPTGPNPLHN